MSKDGLLINLSFLTLQDSGLTTYAKNLVPHLQPLNPTLLTSYPLDIFNSHLILANLTQEQGTKGNLNRVIWTQFQLPKLYNHLNASLLFSPIPEAPIYTNCRFVVTVHDLIPLRFPKPLSLLTLYYRYYLPYILNQAQHIICVSQATAKDLNDFFGIPATKMTVIPSGYDQNTFRPLQKTPPLSPYFLYIGRYDPHKNLSHLIKAFAALPNCQDYQLWLVGSYDTRFTPLLQNQVRELGLSEQIKFLNYVAYEQLPVLLNQALALVFPSLWEGFGLPVLEAMACGTPIITSNLSSLPEVAGEAALYVNPYQNEEITAAMAEIARNEQLRLQLSHFSLQRASQFSWQKTGQATAEILAQFL